MKRILALAMIVVLGVALFGCSSATGKLKKIQDGGEMVVYTDPNFPPFEFMGSNGVQGVDPEIARAIAAELGVSVRFEEAVFDAILMSIKGGKGDMAISGFTILEERKESVDFSDPYIESVQYLILPEESNISVVEDLAGLLVGVAKGYSGQYWIQDEIDDGVLTGTGTTLNEYNSANEAALDLNVGRIDAVVMDEFVAKNIASKTPGLVAKEMRFQDGELASEEYGVAVAKGNEDLLDIVNKVIRDLKSSGQIAEWVVHYSDLYIYEE